MELRQLEYFIAVAEELNFGKAALRLQMTQPPLSQQILQLEQEIGVKLFLRTTRHVELTRAGQAFLQEAKSVLSKVQDAMDTARLAEKGKSGSLAVGFVGSSTYDLLPKAVRLYHERYPNVELILHELSTPDQLRGLQHRDIDVGVLRLPVADKNLTVKVVQSDQCVVAAPLHHSLSTCSKVSLENLATEGFVSVPRATWSGFYDELIGLCHNAGFSPHIVQEASDFHTVIGLVAGGVGISIVPASARNFHTRDVVYLPLSGPSPSIEMAVAWVTHNEDILVQNFVNVVELSTKQSIEH